MFITLNALEYDFDEAYVIALVASGELVPPTDLLNRVESEVEQINEAYPAMDSFYMLPGWVPGSLIIGLTDEALALYNNGEYHHLDSLNEVYGLIAIQGPFIFRYFDLEFETIYNPWLLGDIYESAWGVQWAGPDLTTDYHRKELVSYDSTSSLYNFEYRYGDCPNGCISHRHWYFSFSEGLLDSFYDEGDEIFRVDFTQDTTIGVIPFTVQFTDWTLLGYGADTVESIAWDFDGDGVDDSFEQHPSHTYNEIGAFTVKLTVEYEGEVRERVKSDLIRVVESMSTANPEVPSTLILSPPYPNPFNPAVTIPFQLFTNSDVKISIYGITGEVVWEEVLPNQSAGTHFYRWDASNFSSVHLNSGLYILKMSTNTWSESRRLILMK